jgi:hypothetical protein
VNYPDVLKQLLQGGRVSLASWFAVPLGIEQAQAAALEIQQRLLTGRYEQMAPFNFRLAEIIFRYWAGYEVAANVKNFSALLQDKRERAMLALCYGQLLMVRKQVPAWDYLDHGFQLATHLLEPEDYFKVLKRHELLRQLPLQTAPSAAAPLDALLDEARIIARLKGNGRRAGMAGDAHQDTVD